MDGQEVLQGKGGQVEGKVAFRAGVVGDESLFCPGQPSTGPMRPEWRQEDSWYPGPGIGQVNGKIFLIRHGHVINLGDFSGEID